MKILLPDSLPFNLDVPEGVEQVTYAAKDPVPTEHADAEVLVIWNSPRAAMAESARRLAQLRLVQALPAGPDFLPKLNFPAGAALCNGVGLHGRLVSEHAIALTLALMRGFPELLRAQQDHEWAPVGGAQELRPAAGPVTSFYGSKVVVWGFGDLGQWYARHAAGFGAEVVGIARSAGDRAGFPVTDDAASVLGDADVVCLCLPSADRPAVDADALAAMRDGVLIVNVGRGTAIDEDALLSALRSGKVGGAGLDVFDPEPLPSDSELWDEPNVLITPHSAGGRPLGYDDLISRNVRHLLAGEEFENRMGR